MARISFYQYLLLPRMTIVGRATSSSASSRRWLFVVLAAGAARQPAAYLAPAAAASYPKVTATAALPPPPSVRFEQTKRLIEWATSRGVEGFDFDDESSSSSSPSATAALSPENGLHGPRIVAARDIQQHECILSVPFSCLVNVSSWAVDTALGRRLAAEGVVTGEALLGGAALVDTIAAGEFQGSEPLLAFWFLLQRRKNSVNAGTTCGGGSGTPGTGTDNNVEDEDADHPYFASLDGPGVSGGVDARCAFAWSEQQLRQRLTLGSPPSTSEQQQQPLPLLSPFARRAFAARSEVVAAFKTLRSLLARSNVWQRFLEGHDGAGGAGGGEDVTLEEFLWAFATVASRAIRFGKRGQRSTWSSLYMEPIGDLLNHAPPPHANVFRFLNEGSGRIQYHAEDGGVAAGSELLYTYGALTPADSLLFYGFTVDFSEDTLLDSQKARAAAGSWRRALDQELGGGGVEPSSSSSSSSSIASYYDEVIQRLEAEIAASSSEDGRRQVLLDCLEDCRRLLVAERTCLLSGFLASTTEL